MLYACSSAIMSVATSHTADHCQVPMCKSTWVSQFGYYEFASKAWVCEWDYDKQEGVSHRGLAIYIKRYLKRQKKKYGNSNIFTMQKYNLQKIL
jgi:hypothetical protein